VAQNFFYPRPEDLAIVLIITPVSKQANTSLPFASSPFSMPRRLW
jgi:hypothetical protein